MKISIARSRLIIHRRRDTSVRFYFTYRNFTHAIYKLIKNESGHVYTRTRQETRNTGRKRTRSSSINSLGRVSRLLRRLRQHLSQDEMGQSRDYSVRDNRNAALPPLPQQYRRHSGQKLQMDLRPLLPVQVRDQSCFSSSTIHRRFLLYFINI